MDPSLRDSEYFFRPPLFTVKSFDILPEDSIASRMSSNHLYPDLHTEYAVTHGVLIIVFSFVACVAFAVRLCARRIQKLALSLSDYTIILGLVSYQMYESLHNLNQADILTGRVWTQYLRYTLSYDPRYFQDRNSADGI